MVHKLSSESEIGPILQSIYCQLNAIQLRNEATTPLMSAQFELAGFFFTVRQLPTAHREQLLSTSMTDSSPFEIAVGGKLRQTAFISYLFRSSP